MFKIVSRLFVITILALAGGNLSGCGKKGPLYLPDTTEQPAGDEQSEERSKKKN